MKRAVDVLMILIGIIALVGSVLSMFILTQLGEALDQISQIPSVGEFDSAAAGTLAAPIRLLAGAGWIWSISVFIVSIYTIYCAYMRIKSQGNVLVKK